MAREKDITLGFSPCPNDTFIFNALVSGKVPLPGIQIRQVLHDVETLNQMAFDDALDMTKLSFYAWLCVKDRYRLCSSGGALGFGCGPVVVSPKKLNHGDMSHCRIVLPGEWTTAHLLFRLWAPGAQDRVFVPYDRIFDTLASGQADCGVIIHESRFTFRQLGLHQVVDLGAWWEETTSMPIPLGCIAAHQRIGIPTAEKLDQAIAKSIALARQDPDATGDYVRSYAQEMTPEVLNAHIHTFVNEFSVDIGPRGRAAVAALETKARQSGIIP